MIHRLPGPTGRIVRGAVLGLIGMALAAATPAAAQTAYTTAECRAQTGSNGKQKGQVTVHFAQGSGDVTLIAQGPAFIARVEVRVECKVAGDVLGLVTDAAVVFSTTVPNATFDGLPSGVSILVPGGTSTVTMSSTDPGLAAGQVSAQVGTETVTLVGSTNFDRENVYARTPELGSLALFGAGAAGMASYGLTRLRAGRRRRS